MSSSNASANFPRADAVCRLAWRRSTWMLAALGFLTVLACAALWWSGLPASGRSIGCVAVVAYAAWLLVREARRPPVDLTWAGGDAPWQMTCEDRTRELRHVGANLRGGLVVLTLVDTVTGRCERFVWWPDTLDAADRRTLRLALIAMQVNATRSTAATRRDAARAAA
ncbi:MAG: hypothetical protein JSR34_11610 [Proteobacteria bacterium]|nr:hypothetical protein [Pseudomonadota bacterium]